MQVQSVCGRGANRGTAAATTVAAAAVKLTEEQQVEPRSSGLALALALNVVLRSLPVKTIGWGRGRTRHYGTLLPVGRGGALAGGYLEADGLLDVLHPELAQEALVLAPE